MPPSPFFRRALLSVLGAFALGSSSCRRAAPTPPADFATLTWEQIEAQARGQTVNLAMWQGDPFINAYMRDYVAPALLARHGVTLRLLPGQGGELVSMLMTEIEARKAASEIDLMWINGETFYQLRQLKALYGPFTDRLPNARYVDFASPFIGVDFQQPVDGMECPWGGAQLLAIYHEERVPAPPRTRAALAEWVRAHPGRFTFDSSFTGMSFLKSLLYEIVGDRAVLAGPFDEAKYARYGGELWAYLKSIQPYLWPRAARFPTA